MTNQGRDDRDAVDRAFAELIAGYHLTAEPRVLGEAADPDEAGREPRSEREPEDREPDPARTPGQDRGQVAPIGEDSTGPKITLDSRWADQHPLFVYTEPLPEPAPQPVEERYEPGPPPPWPHPSAAVLVGWIGVAFAVLTLIAAALGAPIPPWVAWTAMGTFVGGFALLLSRLPQHRPPNSGDGAVL